jgi:hypothetical protein
VEIVLGEREELYGEECLGGLNKDEKNTRGRK